MAPKTEIKGSVRDYVYQRIKQQIVNLELEPGRKVFEKEMAERLQVSKTPVREAFQRLAQEELLGVIPQSGTMIMKIDLSLVEEGRFVRENIEKAVVKEACRSFDSEQLFQVETNIALQLLCLEKGSYQRLFELDEAFHSLLFEGCHKIHTWNLIRQMNTHFDRLRVLRLAANPEWEVVVSQHKAVFDCIAKRDEEGAEEKMSTHLKLVNFEKEELKTAYPGYFQ
ncbi:GntR family transcriptional regulator [Sediminibacillus halophilus]|uniref:GntR family transcriptional regulator n=1 Tax=Sediminibacillus halophilus TaxID=482461 RepID=UPI0009450F58|nr:GntR family transcriptional regulator [Sediminibacillus halophilus]